MGKQERTKLRVIQGALDSIADEIADDVLRRFLLIASPPVACGINLAKTEKRQRELEKAAHEAGKAATMAAFKGLFLNPKLMGLVARYARGQSARKAQNSRKNRAGGKPAGWRQGLQAKALKNKRFMNKMPSAAEIVERLIHELVIDEGDGGEYFCHETGERVATSLQNLASEISKEKAKLK